MALAQRYRPPTAVPGPDLTRPTWASMGLDLLRTLRPHQWVKNLIVFAPMVFSLRVDAWSVAASSIAFICFCAYSSAVYLLNDCIDMAADLKHPTKRFRPIAAGRISRASAFALSAGLVLGATVLAANTDREMTLTLALYLGVQIAYNLGLKREPIIDILCIAAGFVLRALAASAAASIPISTWFLLCVALLALFLAIEKRLSETRSVGSTEGTRAVLQSYSVDLLLRMESVVGASALMAYGLWAAQKTRNHWMLATVPIVAYVLFRYQMLSERGAEDAPERVLLRSPHMIVAASAWIVVTVGLLLLQGHGSFWASCDTGC